MTLSIEPLGYIRSPYAEKFSVPRQPGLVTATTSTLVFTAPYNNPDMLADIEQFSHFWLIFAFHQNSDAGWKAKVRPPRLGGNQKVGVLASRSSFRPNNLGLSLMQLSHVVREKSCLELHFKGGDLVDGTPIYDVKPYLPYSDSEPNALAGYAQSEPTPALQINWHEDAEEHCNLLGISKNQQQVIEQVLAQDPRPAYKRNKPDDKIYGVHLYDLNIRWQVINSGATRPQLYIMSLSHV
ncbi:tRNA (N6-threonylcarbamoyladenosine(37)-N6)-methyltransferase TrmO [Agarivorans sp. TSD2052]|uniref:tRNA (N6-threonylcarbamoyladenosine(37)-N6)-methyltransferase TrmO n=1 Tax=Agarivorans sp. TSD2052 TaxID=2937286 RepID=UPI0020103F4F|nr:tRNA (N6-threonylcarbamoyladenosine(37)-N6)-methyltransferase TrmO [Agarivorans sp. TSD2052]UPW17128.1 tRNA (N6-threonylcarbamoyladenosine(37)-N6)-methyltransferase TrmO [Agarivorans sp. TSD2052]